MDDLISRQAAIEELDRAAWGVEWDKALAKAMLESLPSVLPEIIRCKDCKHYLRPHGCGYIDGMVTAQEDGFCSCAERRSR